MTADSTSAVDVVERLRARVNPRTHEGYDPLCQEAACTIFDLRTALATAEQRAAHLDECVDLSMKQAAALRDIIDDLCNKNDALEQRADTAERERDEARAKLSDLANAERGYRYTYEQYGSSRIETGRAWDVMRRAGDRARALKSSEAGKDSGEER